jgi:glycerol-3-phosphate dehydrogenase
MGRCQGGFCGPQIARILAEELGISETEILQEGTGSKLLVSEMAEKERLSKAPEGGAR